MFSPRRRQLTRPFLVRAHILKNLQELKDSNPHRAVLEAAVFHSIKLNSHVVELPGLEPELSCVSDRRVNQLH